MRERNWLPWLLLAIVYALLVAISWKRWANPIVDCGREMYVPWQIAEGAMLYRDLFWMYGPLVPYWHALLFHLIGVHLNILYAVGLLLVAAHGVLICVLARRVMGNGLAALASMLFLAQFAFRPALNNLVFPYSFNAAYASALNLLALWSVLKHRETNRALWLVIASSSVGLSLLSKPELGLAGFAFLLLSAVFTLHASRFTFSTLAPAILLPLLGYGWLAWQLGPSTLLYDSLWPRHVLAEMEFFHQFVVGTLFEPKAIVYLVGLSVVGIGVFLAVLSVAYLAQQHVHKALASLVIAGFAILFIALPISGRFFHFLELNYIYAGNLIFLLIAVFVSFRQRHPPSSPLPPLRFIAVFALLSTWRAPLFAGLSAYSSFFMPASVIVFVWLWTAWIPKAWSYFDEANWRHVASVTLAVLLALQWSRVLVHSRTQFTHPLTTARGEMIVHRDIGPQLSQLASFLSSNTAPNEAVLLFPEETSLYFLCGLRSPSKYYQFAPGLLPSEKEQRLLIDDAERENVRWVTVSNRATTEYGKPYFGIHYSELIREWLLDNFHLVETIGDATRAVPPPPPSRYWPAEGYGIEIYRRNE